MRRQNVQLKRAILDWMEEKDYNAMVKIMADDIYNEVEYDIIILLARKCSNLYTAMLPLVKEERDGLIEERHCQLVYAQKGKEPIVLTDRALDWVIWKIRQDASDKSSMIRKILLVDDIIIHGRTLSRIKDRLEKAFLKMKIEDYSIDIVTFAANTEELLIAEEEICNLEDIRKCTISDWKLFSGQIVDIIYLMGQTYTSYVPKLRFQINSETGKMIRQYIDQGGMSQITDPAREALGVKIYACIAEGQEKYKVCESYRIYEFLNQGEYVLVPMVSLQAVDEECLNQYIDILIESGVIIPRKEQERNLLEVFLKQCSGEYKYRLVIYVVSAFAGWHFLKDCIGTEDEQSYDRYDQEVETYNFYILGIKSYSQLQEEQVDFSEISTKLEEKYCAMSLFEGDGNVADVIEDADVKKLATSLGEIIKESSEKNTNIDVLGKLLTVNSKIDEENYRASVNKDEKDIQDRVMGIPLIDIIQMLMNKGRMTLASAFMSVLKAIDYGRGSIVAHCFTLPTGKRWYTSLVHAGEENYRYYINQYLPVLYGLSMMEFHGNSALAEDKKKEYWEKFYKESPDLKYLDVDKDYLVLARALQEMKDVVEYDALYKLKYEEKEALYSAIKMAKEYMR